MKHREARAGGICTAEKPEENDLLVFASGCIGGITGREVAEVIEWMPKD